MTPETLYALQTASEQWEMRIDHFAGSPSRVVVINELGYRVADCGLAGNAAAERHARLIAAAPELLAACKAIEDGLLQNWTANLAAVRAAIAKAEGRSA